MIFKNALGIDTTNATGGHGTPDGPVHTSFINSMEKEALMCLMSPTTKITCVWIRREIQFQR
jgi:hypothetical protein